LFKQQKKRKPTKRFVQCFQRVFQQLSEKLLILFNDSVYCDRV